MAAHAVGGDTGVGCCGYVLGGYQHLGQEDTWWDNLTVSNSGVNQRVLDDLVSGSGLIVFSPAYMTARLLAHYSLLSIPAMSPPRSLHALLGSLPQELYDNVYDQVFTADPSDVLVSLLEPRKFPPQLHVDRASRASYASSYFTATRFIFDCSDETAAWCNLIEQAHFEMLAPSNLFYVFPCAHLPPKDRDFSLQPIRQIIPLSWTRFCKSITENNRRLPSSFSSSRTEGDEASRIPFVPSPKVRLC